MSAAVQAMFGRIAPTYDLVNRVLSLGIDRAWRQRAVAALGPLAGRQVLDVCAGTLDLTLLLRRAGAEVTAVDFSAEMLERGRPKLGGDPGVELRCADAQALPFADASFDGAVCGFGLRNLDDPAAGLAEARRVLRPGGRLVVLDFFRPARAPARLVQRVYNRAVLPLVGGLLSGDRAAYGYLVASIERFALREEVEALARKVGFARAGGVDLSLGIASLVVAEVA